MKMGVRKFDGNTTVLSCPGCERWQVDYTDAAASEFAILAMDPGDEHPTVSMVGWHQVLEAVIHEHMDECLELQAIYAML